MQVDSYFNLTQYAIDGKRIQSYNFSLTANSGSVNASNAVSFNFSSYYNGYVNITQTTDNSVNVNSGGLINLDTSIQGRQVFPFPAAQWFVGTIVDYSIQCDSCNNSKIMRIDNTISYNRSISTNQYQF